MTPTDKNVLVTACVSNTVWLVEIVKISVHRCDSSASYNALINFTLSPSLQNALQDYVHHIKPINTALCSFSVYTNRRWTLVLILPLIMYKWNISPVYYKIQEVIEYIKVIEDNSDSKWLQSGTFKKKKYNTVFTLSATCRASPAGITSNISEVWNTFITAWHEKNSLLKMNLPVGCLRKELQSYLFTVVLIIQKPKNLKRLRKSFLKPQSMFYITLG